MRQTSRSKPASQETGAAARRLLKLAGSPPTIEAAVQGIVQKLLAGLVLPPTDLNAVAARLDVSVIGVDDLPVSGELRRVNGQLTVVYSSDLPLGRRNFTVAHELGHAIFERTGRNCPRSGREVERLCDKLAAELLMPRKVFLAKTDPDPTLAQVHELAQSFGTSLQATALRCYEVRRISVGEADAQSIRWGTGLLGRSAQAHGDGEIRNAISLALAGEAGTATVFVNAGIWSGLCRLEWSPMAQASRALLLLRPLPQSELVCITAGSGRG